MIAVDTNILVYADREESARHAAALRAVQRLAEGDGYVRLLRAAGRTFGTATAGEVELQAENPPTLPP